MQSRVFERTYFKAPIEGEDDPPTHHHHQFVHQYPDGPLRWKFNERSFLRDPLVHPFLLCGSFFSSSSRFARDFGLSGKGKADRTLDGLTHRVQISLASRLHTTAQIIQKLCNTSSSFLLRLNEYDVGNREDSFRKLTKCLPAGRAIVRGEIALSLFSDGYLMEVEPGAAGILDHTLNRYDDQKHIRR